MGIVTSTPMYIHVECCGTSLRMDTSGQAVVATVKRYSTP